MQVKTAELAEMIVNNVKTKKRLNRLFSVACGFRIYEVSIQAYGLNIDLIQCGWSRSAFGFGIKTQKEFKAKFPAMLEEFLINSGERFVVAPRKIEPRFKNGEPCPIW